MSDSVIPPKRRSMYNEMSISNEEVTDKKSKKSNKKSKTPDTDKDSTLKVIPVLEVIEEIKNISSKNTSYFNRFLKSLELYLRLIREEENVEVDIDKTMQLYLNSFNLETNFDKMIAELMKFYHMPLDQSISSFISFYYEWTTGLIPSIIAKFPEDKKFYDNVMAIVSKYSDKIDT